MRVLRYLQILLVGGTTIALLSACGQTPASTLEDPLDVLFSSMVHINFETGPRQTGRLVVVSDNETQTSQSEEATLGWSLGDEMLRLQLRVNSEPIPINWAEVASIEPVGEVSVQTGNGTMRLRGSDDGVPEPWDLPMQQFYLNPDNNSAAIQGVDDLFTSGQQQAIAAHLQAIQTRNGIGIGYIVSEIRFLSDSNIEVSVEAVELSE